MQAAAIIHKHDRWGITKISRIPQASINANLV